MAQEVTPPTIHRVTIDAATGVLTIAGTGLSADLIVTVEGRPLAVMPGATSSKMEAVATADLLTVPGTYRLTVIDPRRRVGDAFIVASHPRDVPGQSGAPFEVSTVAPKAFTSETGVTRPLDTADH